MKLGVNIDPRHGFNPSDVIGQCTRTVLVPNDPVIYRWLEANYAQGIQPLLVFARESLLKPEYDTDLNNIEDSLKYYKDTLPYLITYIQIGNEPDAYADDAYSSWKLNHETLNKMLARARMVFHDANIVAPALTSDDEAYANKIDWSLVDIASMNTYVIKPNYENIKLVLKRVLNRNRPIWITEYVWNKEQTQAFKDSGLIDQAYVFCWSNAMVPGYGLIENADKFKEYTAMVQSYSVGQGILAAMNEQNDTPATDEVYFNGYSLAYGQLGNQYVYLPETNKVYIYEPKKV